MPLLIVKHLIFQLEGLLKDLDGLSDSNEGAVLALRDGTGVNNDCAACYLQGKAAAYHNVSLWLARILEETD